MRIEIVAFEEAPAAAWDDLSRVGDNPFFERWAAAAALGLPEAAGMRLLLGWDGATLSGLLPIQRRTAMGIAVATQNWDQRIRATGGALVRPGREADFWAAAIDHLDRAGHGAWLRLSTLPADAPSTIALIAMLRRRGRPVEETRRYARAVLRGGHSSHDHAKAHIRAKVLKEHRRLRARLSDRGTLAFEQLGPDTPADPWIDTLFALELTGWKGRDGVAAAADHDAERAFRALLRGAHDRGRLDFHRMTVGGQPIAALACIEGPGDTALQLKIAYDEGWAAFSPGVLLEMAYLEHALDRRRLALVDSCARAGHPMIDRIWPDRRAIVSLAIPFDRWSSRIAMAAHGAARRLRARAAPAAITPPAEAPPPQKDAA